MRLVCSVSEEMLTDVPLSLYVLIGAVRLDLRKPGIKHRLLFFISIIIKVTRWATAVVAAMSFQASSLDVVAGESLAVSNCAKNDKVSKTLMSLAAAKSSTVLNDGRPVTPEGSDKWMKRYVQRSPGGSAKSSSVANNNGNNIVQERNIDAMDGSSTSDSRPAMPTRKHSKHLKPPMMSPRLEDVEETITRAFGSVLDPQSKRAKWACAACSVMFVRVRCAFAMTELDIQLT